MIFKFLMGLNKNLNKIRRKIIRMKSLPYLRNVFSEVNREENIKNVMVGDGLQALLLSKTLPWLPQDLILTQITDKEKEDFSMIIVKNQVILKTITRKFIEKQLIWKTTKSAASIKSKQIMALLMKLSPLRNYACSIKSK